MDEVPDNIRKKRPGEGMFVVRYMHVHVLSYRIVYILYH